MAQRFPFLSMSGEVTFGIFQTISLICFLNVDLIEFKLNVVLRQVALFAAAGSNNSFILKILEDGGLDTSSDPLLCSTCAEGGLKPLMVNHVLEGPTESC